MMQDGAIQNRYSTLELPRTPFLNRAREASKLTIPSLLPPEGFSSQSELPTPWQATGARGVNNLSAKLLLTLLPPNAPFFRLKIDDFTLRELTQREEQKAETEEALGDVERAIQTEIETSAVRVPTFETLKHLIVAGNVLLHLPPDGGMRVFHLDRYVVKRDPMGNVLEHITKESLSSMMLTPELRELIGGTSEEEDRGEKPIDLYTQVRREVSRSGRPVWRVSQEIKGKEVPGSRGTHPIDDSPWMALRFSRIDNEDYGRGFVEEYLGDLKSLEGLTRAIVEGSAAAAKVLFLVAPNSTTKAKTLAEAPNGSIREGNADDVSVLSLDKFNDFRVTYDTITMINDRLAAAFLINSSVQRQAERVTAEEIRFVAGELEDALGGVFSILSQEFQLPLVTVIMKRMQKAKKLPKFPKLPGGGEVVKPLITTGLEALGRGQDLTRLRGFMDDISILTQAKPGLLDRIDDDELLTRIATARGLDIKGLLVEKEVVAQKAQQKQLMQLLSELGPEGIKALTQVATKGLASDQQPAASPATPPQQ